MTLAEFLNLFLGILTVIVQIISLILLLVLIFPKTKQTFSVLTDFVSKHSFLLSFLVALCATLGSLLYSDVVGYEPCKLCWFQRIFMYPQVLLLGLAMWRKERVMAFYSIVLSSVGALVALYHYLGQLGVTNLPCPAVGYSVSCAKVFTLQFGYITIPLMALSAFVFIVLAFIFSQKHSEVTNLN